MAKARVAVLISGTGTNMAALLYAAKAADCPFEIVLVASNNPDAVGLKLAEAEGIPTFSHPHKGLSREAHDSIMHDALVAAKTEFVALAGYMRILSPEFVSKWEGRMLNIHPSLLPMYKGLHTHERAIEAGDSYGGCSVHLVTAELDDGPILGQTPVAILPSDNADSLAARVLIAEHQLYSRTLADYVMRERTPEWLIEQVRIRAIAQTEAEETVSHGMPCFGIIGGKKFAYVSRDHHGDGKLSLLVKISGAEEQAMLIEQDEDRYYRPAYFGDGWIAIRLDLGDNDWDHIGEWLAKSWLAVAPKKLVKLLEIANEF
ncbi:MAG: phosphoribosylglycinamide formyltransferase [Sphingomonadales bacterium]|nr:phosphoribosylglycinamide formyltransferase [Sphingomonadales bacterium]